MTRDMPPFVLDGKDPTALTLDEVYAGLVQAYGSSIEWYFSEKKAKASWSKRLRLLSLVLAVLGGLVPLVAPLTDLPSSWGYVLLAVAAGLLLIDRYFGFSDSWSRYVGAAVRLNQELLLMQVRFAAARSHAVDDEGWRVVQEAAEQLGAGVAGETSAWVNDLVASVRDQQQSSTKSSH